MTRYAVLAGALLLAACAGHTKVSQPAQTEWPPREMTQAECAVAGGNWGPVGLMQVEACTLRAPDAGKQCSDSSECAGACWSDGAPGSKGTGYCQPTNMPFGCHSEVREGMVQPALCAD